MGKFNGFYIFSDVDGTLLTRKYQLPDKTRDAIAYFTENGGHFALATGRGINARTKELAQQVGVNSPCILLNGAIIYDFANDEVLSIKAPDQLAAKRFLNKICSRLSNTHTISAWHPYGSEQLGIFRPYMVDYSKVSPEELNGDIIKMVIGHDKPLTEEVKSFIYESVENGLYVTSSGAEFLEIMPEGVNKGWGVERFIESLSLNRSKVITMGDYMNDYSMLSLEGIKSFCPEVSAEDVKKVCFKILCPVEDSPAAEVIKYIEDELL